MKSILFLTVAAVFVATVSAAGKGGSRIDVDQELGGFGNEGHVSGLLNNLLKGGLLADASKGSGGYQEGF
ncbi:uncharacterized protein BYT42DRAFT_618675 [Radiomyces spectabilis]|uniref:uncharacterized protein n=1 Tax=Radiomyces spectabilis TaxID=64574 RepID=UPI002220CA71|nr:uncharacterized protein BYT42DRAFT_618675 [Radiomyces spectabilis]KAI8365295.1 hypothetical protein BYT42DRAFT_618675 [Radiomyces spectabilis]